MMAFAANNRAEKRGIKQPGPHNRKAGHAAAIRALKWRHWRRVEKRELLERVAS